MLSLQQIARTWWPQSVDAPRVAENRLRLLLAEKLLEIERAPAHPELQLQAPVVSWDLGGSEPDFAAISYRLQSRWRDHPVLTTCISASKLAVDRFGGYGGRPPRAVERTHDIHMAQVFLHYRAKYPNLARDWIFEEQVKAERKRATRSQRLGGSLPSYASNANEKLPDAFLRSQSGNKVIEFGGAYDKDKLTSFHGYCKEYSFSYEIW